MHCSQRHGIVGRSGRSRNPRESEPEDPEETLSLAPVDRGELLHEVLGRALGPEKARQSLPELVRERYKEFARANLTGGGVLDEVEVERIVAWAQVMAAFADEQSEGYETEESESKVRASIDAGEDKVEVQARLDRVDRGVGEEKRIVDYKSGKAKSDFTDKKLADNSFNYGSTLQVPLYLLAYAAAHAEAARDALSAAYWYLNKEKGVGKPRAVKFEPEFLSDKLAALGELLAAAVDGIRQGRFVPRPDVARKTGNTYCANCPFTVTCDPQSRPLLGIRGDKAGCCPWMGELGRIDE